MEFISIADKRDNADVLFNNGEVAIFNGVARIDVNSEIVPQDMFCFILCTSGSSEVKINGNHYSFLPDNLIAVPPRIVLQGISVSDDFKCLGISISIGYVQRAFPMAEKFWSVKRTFEKHPLIAMENRHVRSFHQYVEIIEAKIKGTPIKHINEVVESLVQAFIFEFLDIFDRFISLIPQKMNAGERVFNSFIKLLSDNMSKKNNVAYFARQLNISPKYLSMICRKSCGVSASDVIDRHVCDGIEYLLKNSSKSVKEIAYALNFANVSFFGKFVSRHYGMSPTKLRESLLSERSFRAPRKETV